METELAVVEREIARLEAESRRVFAKLATMNHNDTVTFQRNTLEPLKKLRQEQKRLTVKTGGRK